MQGLVVGHGGVQHYAHLLVVAGEQNLSAAPWVGPGVEEHPEHGRVPRDLVANDVGRHVQVIRGQFLKIDGRAWKEIKRMRLRL